MGGSANLCERVGLVVVVVTSQLYPVYVRSTIPLPDNKLNIYQEGTTTRKKTAQSAGAVSAILEKRR